MIKRMDTEAEPINQLDLSAAPAGKTTRFWLRLVRDGLGLPVHIPLIVARGREAGPVVGITAAVHGNELNGIPVIQRLFREIDTEQLKGTIVGVPVLNVPSFLSKKRRFPDGTDLNHIMPGKPDGNVSQVYAWRIVDRIIRKFDYLIDLHTASTGRINSYYIRADMSDPTVRQMALLQGAQIIVHNPPNDGTLRGTANALSIPAITLEVGNPSTFQKGMIRDGLTGIHNLLGYLGMTNAPVEKLSENTVLCRSSYWIYTDTGGIMTVHPKIIETVEEGQVIATLRNIFGDVVREYTAPEAGIVIGKSVSPINQTGGRILHLGLLDD